MTAAQPVVVPGRGRRFHVVVGPETRRSHRSIWLALLTVVAIFFVLIWSRTALDRSAFVLDDLESRIEAEEARYWELRLEVSRLQSPERIAGLATEMGMVYPDELMTIEVRGLGEPGPGIEERWTELKALLSAGP